MNPNDLTNDADFFLVPRDLIPQSRLLKSSSLACLLYLWSRPADKKGWIAAGTSEIGRTCKIQTRTAFSALARLEQLRLIRKRKKAGNANAYRLLWRRRRPAAAKSATSHAPGAAAADPTDPHAQTASQPPSAPESGSGQDAGLPVPETPACVLAAAEPAELGGARGAEQAPQPPPEERSPSITEQITRLLPEVYAKPCDIDDLKARCGFNDEQLLKALERLRQRGVVVAADAPVGLLAAALCSPE
jgi:hypothetical protein